MGGVNPSSEVGVLQEMYLRGRTWKKKRVETPFRRERGSKLSERVGETKKIEMVSLKRASTVRAGGTNFGKYVTAVLERGRQTRIR